MAATTTTLAAMLVEACEEAQMIVAALDEARRPAQQPAEEGRERLRRYVAAWRRGGVEHMD